jgi:hypothetical protein
MQAAQLLQMTKEEQMLFTSSSDSPEPLIDNTIHRMDKTLITTLKDKLKVQEVWKQGTEGSCEGVDAIARHGYLDTNACRQTITKTADAGAVVTVVSKREMDRRHEGVFLHKWSTTKKLYCKGGSRVTNGVDGVDIHHSVNSSP